MNILPKYNKEGMFLNKIRRDALNKLNKMVYFEEIKVDQVKNCFCGHNKFNILSQYDRFGLPFGTKICLNCGLITQNIRIHPDSMPIFYQDIYWDLVKGEDPDYQTPLKKNHSLGFINDFMNSFNKKKINIFEVGCGAGDKIISLSKILKEKGYMPDLYGCDYNLEALKVAKNKGLNTLVGGMNELKKIGKADILILSHIFEHFPNLNESMKEIYELTHEDTLIYIEVPGVKDLKNKKEYFYDYQDYNVLAHTYNFSLTTLSNVMGKGGFKNIYGDEFVRSIFKRDNNTNFVLKNDFKNIIESLKEANIKYERLNKFRNNTFIKYLKNLIKAILNI